LVIGYRVAAPADLAQSLEEAWARVRATPGFLTEREARFLALIAACTPAAGVILEIGSYKGKSTVGLASIALRYGLGPVVAVDPHSSPSITDPGSGAGRSSWDEFQANLRAAGVGGAVEAHRVYSRDLARDWHRPIRLLWIDGDHTYSGAKADFDLFHAHLVSGGIVALHDVLHMFEGPDRVFAEDILRSDSFGPAGLCGSIGWAQYRPADGARWRVAREALARRFVRVIPLVKDGRAPTGLRKLLYKFWRRMVPHGAPNPATWLETVQKEKDAGPRGFSRASP
jgi:MMP 1-O-methyltransferase